MALFIISIPLMLGAVALAVIPLLVMSRSQHRKTVGDVHLMPDVVTTSIRSEDPELSRAA
jgi:hypothetical protein